MPNKFILSAVCAAIFMLASTPTYADDAAAQIAELKQELAAQRKLLEQVLAAQNNAPRSPSDASEYQQKLSERQKAPIDAPTSTATAPIDPSMPTFKIFGTVDLSVARANSGYGPQTRIEGAGGMAPSRIGVQATSAFSNFKVTAVAEAGLQYDNGGAGNGAPANGLNDTAPSGGGILGTGTQLFSRQLWGGVDAGFGQISIGRQYTGSYVMGAAVGSAHGDGFYGNTSSMTSLVGIAPRFNNSIIWATPQVANLRAVLDYTTGSENNVSGNVVSGATTTTSMAGRGYDLEGLYSYTAGQAAVTTWNYYNATFATAGETGLAKKRGYQLSANYDFGPFKLFGDVTHGTTNGGNYQNVTKTLSEANAYGASVLVPFGPHHVVATWTHIDDRSQLNKDGTLLGLSYWFTASSNTSFYATAGKLINNRNATYSLVDGANLVGNEARAGFSATGLETGMDFHF